jgi:hypothetical protein
MRSLFAVFVRCRQFSRPSVARNFVLLLALALVASGCATTGPRKSAAIQSVLTQRATVKAKYWAKSSSFEELATLGQAVAELKTINVQNCPPAFQSAWFHYLVQLDTLNTKCVRLAKLAGGGKEGADMTAIVPFVEKSPVIGYALLKAVDEVDDAWGKLEETAMNYGVMPER